MGFDYKKLKQDVSQEKLSAAEIMDKLVGEREIDSSNTGDVVKYAGGGRDGMAWCAALISQAMIDAKQGQWLGNMGEARFSSDALIDQGRKLGLNSNLRENPPNVGSILINRKGHVVMVTDVELGANGKPISYEITHGNWSDKVVQETLTPEQLKGRFETVYVDSRKIDEYHQKHYPLARLFNAPAEVQVAAPAQNPIDLSNIRAALQQNGVANLPLPSDSIMIDLTAPLFPENARNAPAPRQI
jgi:hypothetical protein